MCLICVDLIKNKLTAKEAYKNIGELYPEGLDILDDHDYELIILLDKKEKETNSE